MESMYLCTSFVLQVYLVTSFTVTKETNTSVSVKWEVNDGAKIPSTVEYMPSIRLKTAPDHPSAWQNISWTSNTVSIHLIPFPHNTVYITFYEYTIAVEDEIKEQSRTKSPSQLSCTFIKTDTSNVLAYY